MITLPGTIDALRVATTLYEDLRQSHLVVVGKIVHEQPDDSRSYFDLAVGSIIYGRSQSLTISVVAVGRRVKRDEGLAMSLSTGLVGYAVGEEGLVFLKKTSPASSGKSHVEKGMNYVTVRKIKLGGLEDRQEYVDELGRLRDTVDMRDITRRESIFLDLLSSQHALIVESAVKELGNMNSQQGLAQLARLVHAGNQKIRF